MSGDLQRILYALLPFVAIAGPALLILAWRRPDQRDRHVVRSRSSDHDPVTPPVRVPAPRRPGSVRAARRAARR